MNMNNENHGVEAEEQEELVSEMPTYVLVEFTQLLKLLQRCTECGKLPERKSRGKPRKIEWTKSGTNLTAAMQCGCMHGKDRIRWPTQEYIPGTQTRTGNLALVAASQVAPVSFADLNSLFTAASIPLMSKRQFLRLSKSYVFPAVENAYYRQQADLKNSLSNPISLSIDAQYDSPGYSAELCAVAGIENENHCVLDFAAVHKTEVENVSCRMELQGVKKLTSSVEKDFQIEDIIVDKNPSVCKFLRESGYTYGFDPFHRLKSMAKELRKICEGIKEAEARAQMKELCKQFITHVYSSIERAQNDPNRLKELVYSFFLHIRDLHEWNKQPFVDLIPMAKETKVGPNFKIANFSVVTQCPHVEDATQPVSNHAPIDPGSSFYQKLLEVAAKTSFMNDLERLRHGKNTSFVESFWSVCIRYRPKRKYFPLKGFEIRTMLAVLAFNENRRAELRGDRRISAVYECYSKARGEKVTKIKKGPVNELWKKHLVEEAIARKREQGPGYPFDIEPEDLYEEQEFIVDELEELLQMYDTEDLNE